MAALIVLIAAIFAFTFFYVTDLKEQLIQKKNEIHSLSIRVDSLEKIPRMSLKISLEG